MSTENRNSLSTISRIRENANRFITEQLARNGIEGLVPSHGDILAVLYRGEDVTMKDIADKIRRSKPTVTVLTDKLERLGFVYREKSRNDSRITYIRLTEQGKRFAPVFENISKELNELLCQGFTAEETGILDALLKKMENNLS